MNEKLQGWVLAGQSNMEGYGLLSDPAIDQVENPNVLSFTSAGVWEVAVEPLHWLWESYTPAHAAIMSEFESDLDRSLTVNEKAARHRATRAQGAGLGIAFAKALTEATGVKVALIPCAHGGTVLDQWMPGYKGQAHNSTNTLYGSMLDRIKRARELSNFELKGVLWYQGESDADTLQGAAYGEKLVEFIGHLRSDLNEPELKFVIIQLGKYITKHDDARLENWNLVREAQRKLGETIPHTGVVGTLDLSLCDEIHLDTPSLYRLGERIARAVTRELRTPNLEDVKCSGLTANGYHKVLLEFSGVAGSWPKGSLASFSLTDNAGIPVANFQVMDVSRSSSNGKNVELIIGPPHSEFASGLSISFGMGFAPHCNLVDENDQVLAAFGPRQIKM